MGARILVVDDDPWILRMVTASLRKRSFTVDTARDGRQALDRVGAHAPDVIISDVMMPVMDGWTFIKQLRQDPRFAVIPVIFLTALGKDETKLRSLGMTEEDYLAKPFRFDDLERRVDAALASRGAPTAYGSRPASGPHAAAPPTHASGVHNLPQTHTSGVHPMPQNHASGVHQMPGPTSNSGVHALPGYPPSNQGAAHHPPGYPPAPPPNHNSGVHPMPTAPYPYPPQQYPGQYPPQYGQYPGQYPPQYPGQYPPQYRQYPGQYPPPGQPGQPGQQPPPYPGAGGSVPPPAETPKPRPPSNKQRPRRATGLHGKLEQLGLSSLLMMMEMERKQGVLNLMKPGSDKMGQVFLRGGRVVSARIDGEPELPGKQAIYRMLSWQAGTFSFSVTTVDVEDTVQSSTTHLLMEGARLLDEAGRDEEGL